MQNQPIEYLLSQYVSGQITEKEWEELSAVMLDPDNEQTIRERIAELMLQSVLGHPTDFVSPLSPISPAHILSSEHPAALSDHNSLHALLTSILSVDKTAAGLKEAVSGTAISGTVISDTVPGIFSDITVSNPIIPGTFSDNVPGQWDTGSGGRLFLLRPAFLKWSAAAVLVLAVAAGGYRYLFKRQTNTPIDTGNVAGVPVAIVPGSNKAILTLAGGKQIVLTNAENGVLSEQGNTKVIKLDNGKLSYQTDPAPSGDDGKSAAAGNGGKAGDKGGLSYNTITTPKGGQYQIVLSDGTKVWLNAASSLKFPAVFGGDMRQVELSGEAYFEVAKDKSRPFKVLAGASLVEVLGTHFDLKAYGDEQAIRTTLLEGSVKMEKGEIESGRMDKGEMDKGTRGTLLQPGQQGALDLNSGKLSARDVNVSAAVAWKDGYYFFDRTSTDDVMRQIARWYDVEIVYQGAVPRDEIVGRIPRTANVGEVLHIMELIGIHFKIEGKKIIVMK